MADFEDANSPTWDNVVEGQINLRRRGPRGPSDVHRSRRRARRYALNEKTATLMVRPRGWHLHEKHLVVDGRPVPGVALRLRPLLLPQRARAARARAPARTSTCPRWRATSRRGSGTTSSSRAQERLGHPAAAPSARRCSSRRCPPRSRWTRSCTSCASTPPASTAAGGTTSSASSRSSASDPRAVLPDRGQVTMEQPFMRVLHAAAHQDLPSPRGPRDGRHGGADPDQEGPGRRTRPRSPRCAPTSSAR